MAMDVLRSCYKSNMRLYHDRPDILTPGRWYFCPPGAKLLPLKHAFASQRWDTKFDLGDPPIGEVRGSLGWFSGARKPGLTGLHYCGSPEAWLNGIAYAARPGLEIGPLGIPPCCHPPPLVFIDLGFEVVSPVPSAAAELGFEGVSKEGLTVFGADLVFQFDYTPAPAAELALEVNVTEDVDLVAAELAWELETDFLSDPAPAELAWELEYTPAAAPVTTSCFGCHESPAIWQVTVAGFTGASSAFNGTWSLAWQGGCLWQTAGFGPNPTPGWQLANAVSPDRWQLVTSWSDDGVPRIARWELIAAAWACMGPNTMSGGNVLNTTGAPATLTLTAM